MIKLKDMLFENDDSIHRISRYEESVGINFIKNEIIPEIVDFWNHNKTPRYHINELELIRNFKKVDHYQADDSDIIGTDDIKYQSVSNKNTFEFELYKQSDKSGRLTVAWLTPEDKNYRTRKLPQGLSENTDPNRTINKREEGEALTFIQNQAIPAIVKWYNENKADDRKITVHEMVKNLKKVKQENYKLPDGTFNETIWYESNFKPANFTLTRPFSFEIFKNVQNGKIMIGWQRLDRSNDYMIVPIRGSINIDENTEPNFRISKIEEQEALQFLRKDVLPLVANNWNKAARNGGSPDWYVSDEMIGNHLKKTGHEIGKENDVIEYSSIFPIGAGTLEFSTPFRFKIYKQMSDGKMLIYWALPGGGFNYNSATVFVGYGPLTEGENRIMHLTKFQEAEGLDFIRKTLIPLVVKQWNNNERAFTHPLYVTDKEMIKNLRKVEDVRGIRKSQDDLEKVGEYSTDKASYESIVFGFGKGKRKFRFHIGTNRDGHIVIYYEAPNGTLSRWVGLGADKDDYSRLFGVDTPTIRESVQKPFRISKIQEAEALKFIQTKLIKTAVDEWNLFREPKYEITYQDVLKNLRKIDEERQDLNINHNIDHGHDRIIYGAKIDKLKKFSDSNDGYFIKFYIAIYENQLVVHYWRQGLSSGIFFVHDDQRHEIKEVRGKPRLILTKLDEESVLSAIIKEILPIMIADYDELLDSDHMWNNPETYPKLTLKKISQVLKKYERTNDSVKYLALISSQVSFHFRAIKTEGQGTNWISISCRLSFGHQPRFYDFQISGNGKLVGSRLNENIQSSPLSKVEEEQALRYINRDIIPNMIDKYYNGEFLVKYPRADIERFPRIGYQSVRKNLKKVGDNLYTSKISDVLEFKFDIQKRESMLPNNIFINATIVAGKNFGMWTREKLYRLGVNVSENRINEMKTPSLKELLYENTEFGPITKVEEEQNLASIIKQLLPMVVEMENRRRRQISTPLSDLKPKDIIKTLKKSKIGPYLKIYTIDFPTKKKSLFNQPKFGIYKNHENGMVMIGWEVDDRIGWHWFNVDSDGDLRAVEGDNIPRSTTGMAGLTENIESLNEVAERLSKEEELEALDYIQKDLISTVLQDEYLHFLVRFPTKYPARDYPRITTKDINKNLKKIRSSHDTAVYESVITDDIFFEFHIQKMRGHVMIGFNGPINTDWTWYTLGGKKKTNTKENLNESLETNHPDCLTKLDEEEGVDYITKVLIPKQVEFRNEYNRSGETNVRDVVKTLTKINQIKSGYAPCITAVVYQALFQGEPYLYSIYKKGGLEVVVQRGDDGTTTKIK